jgi:hypothetical protein
VYALTRHQQSGLVAVLLWKSKCPLLNRKKVQLDIAALDMKWHVLFECTGLSNHAILLTCNGTCCWKTQAWLEQSHQSG